MVYVCFVIIALLTTFFLVKGSADFDEFLELLGDCVNLKGFTGFRGGLDVTSKTFGPLFFFLTSFCVDNSTGEKSVYTNWSGIEFMFHITTMLPYFPLDKQHVLFSFIFYWLSFFNVLH